MPEYEGVDKILNKKQSVCLNQRPKKKQILGTADYMAPEVIKGEEQSETLDFWAIGVISYEMLTGALPFNDDSPELIFKNVLRNEIKWPPIGDGENELASVAHNFISQLLVSDPKKRLGANSVEEIKQHKFFDGIVWSKLLSEVVPWLPQGKDADLKNFPNADLRQNVRERKPLVARKAGAYRIQARH